MDQQHAGEVLRNLDLRTRRMEQILPDLPNRQEIREMIDTSIQAAVAPLPTRAEMHEVIQAAVAPLATKEELRHVRDELRRHMDVIAESFRDKVRLVAEGTAASEERATRRFEEVMEKVRQLATEYDGRFGDVFDELRRRNGPSTKTYDAVMAQLEQRLAEHEKEQAAFSKDLERVDTRLQKVEGKGPRKRR